VFIHVVTMGVMQVTVVKVVHVAFVHDGNVSALRAVLVVMLRVVRVLAGAHRVLQGERGGPQAEVSAA
jgi:hypothetical protein